MTRAGAVTKASYNPLSGGCWRLGAFGVLEFMSLDVLAANHTGVTTMYMAYVTSMSSCFVDGATVKTPV